MPAWYYQVLLNQGQRHCQEPHHSIPGQNPPIRRNSNPTDTSVPTDHIFTHGVDVESMELFVVVEAGSRLEVGGWCWQVDGRQRTDARTPRVEQVVHWQEKATATLHITHWKAAHCTVYTRSTVHWQKKPSQLKCRRSPRSSKAHQRWFAQMVTIDPGQWGACEPKTFYFGEFYIYL